MKPLYELWDTESSNLIGTFDTMDDALQVVKAALVEHGPAAFAMVGLGQIEGSGRSTSIAKGMELVELASKSNPNDVLRTEDSS